MATVTGYTAEKMEEILSQLIKSVSIVGDNLVALRYDDTQVNLGNAKGAKGDPGPSGDVTTAQLNAAILASITAHGKGLVAHKEVVADQVEAFEQDNFIDITGASVTFTPVPNRYYRFDFYSSILSLADDTTFDLLLRRDIGGDLLRIGGFAKNDNRAVGLSGSRIIKAPASWNSSRTYKLQYRADTNFEINVKSSVYPTFITVTDLGVL